MSKRLLNAGLLSEEVSARIGDPKASSRKIEGTPQSRKSGRSRPAGISTMSESAVRVGQTNVYADLGLPDADNMFVKAQLAMRIADAIQGRKLTQAKAADVIGMTQPKLSGLLRGHFHGISETNMMECLTALGKDIEIVVRSAPAGQVGRVHVVSKKSSAKREVVLD